MKRFFLIIIATMLTGSMLQAEPVSESRAREVAMKVLAAQPATKASSGDVKLIWDGENAATKAASNPAFYVFGRESGGFVIIAGDDNAQPVLAISDKNQFQVEGMPENVKWWMDGMKTYVRSVSPTSEVKAQWAQFAETKADPIPSNDPGLSGIVIHPTPEWAQGSTDNKYYERSVFNAKCPVNADLQTTLTGCVATALGELLTTLSALYPAAMPTHPTVAQIPGYEVPDGYLPAAAEGDYYNLVTTGYNWAGLRTLTGDAAIRAAIAAGNDALLDSLGYLLADLGAIMRAQYARKDTGAPTAFAPYYMGECFGMNKAAHFDYAEDFTARQWIEKLKTELDQRPVLYSARTATSGHAFLLDGYARYSGSDMFYINFGWLGVDNGYYLIPEFGDYIYSHAAVFDFYPDPTSTYPTILKLVVRRSGAHPSNGFKWEGGVAPTADNGYQVLLDYFYVSNEGGDYNGSFRLVAVDKSDNVKQEIDQFAYSLPANYSVGVYYPASDDKHLSFTPVFGDKIVMQYTTDETDANPDNWAWETITAYAPVGALIDELPLLPAAFIKTDAAYHVGDYFQFKLLNNDYLYAGTVWKITAPDGTVSSNLEQSLIEFQLTQAGAYKIEAAVAPVEGDPVVETITTYIEVN
ncbi:MAG: C10 family peptidase [Bacteroidales bacterium]|nr:C10 family peptidase [Bacteroidales bacterium]